MEKNRKPQIIQAAVKRFTKHGINKTTLDEIARDLRIGKATIYYYFKSKEELYYATIDSKCNEYLNDIETIFNNQDKLIEERFQEFFEYKNLLNEKYQLIYDTVLSALKDNFEAELNAFKNLLQKEKEIVRNVFIKNKLKNSESSLPDFLVIESWGLFLGLRLNQLSNLEPINNIGGIIQKLISKID